MLMHVLSLLVVRCQISLLFILSGGTRLRVNHHCETRYVWHSSSIEPFFILHREPECVLNVEANLNHQMAWQFKGYMGGCHFEVNRSASTLKLDIPYWIDRTKGTPPLQMR